MLRHLALLPHHHLQRQLAVAALRCDSRLCSATAWDRDFADPSHPAYISNDGSVGALRTLFDSHQTVFIRAPPGCGKTTLARDAVRNHPDEFAMMVAPPLKQDDAVVWQHIVAALRGVNPTDVGPSDSTYSAAFGELNVAAGPDNNNNKNNDSKNNNNKKKRKHLIIDECHLLFAESRSGVLDVLTKYTKASVALLSAASGTHASDVTPVHLPQIFWHVPPPNFEAYAARLRRGGAFLDDGAVRMLWALSGANRCTFAKALEWVYGQHQQQKKEGVWNPNDLAVAVCHRDRGFFDKIRESRAVKVNGVFEQLTDIPGEFFRVLYGGPTSLSDAPVATRRACIRSGLLAPIMRGDAEFQEFNWDSEASAILSVPNVVMASYYLDRCRTKDNKEKLKVQTDLDRDFGAVPHVVCTNLLCRALPALDFAEVVRRYPVLASPEGDETQRKQFINGDKVNEEVLSAALKEVVLGHAEKLEIKSLRTASDDRLGRPDLWFGDEDKKPMIAIELVQVDGAVADHRKRFEKLLNYSSAKYKCLVIVGGASERDEVLRAVKRTSSKGVEICGLVTRSDYTEHALYVKREGSDEAEGPYSVPCDSVPRKLVEDSAGALQLVSAQRYIGSARDVPVTSVIVTDGAVTIPVKPEQPTVMHLKKAIKAELAPELDRVAAARIIITHPASGTKLGDEEPLRAGIEYVFEVPTV